jgi:hypothetical protein
MPKPDINCYKTYGKHAIPYEVLKPTSVWAPSAPVYQTRQQLSDQINADAEVRKIHAKFGWL